MDVIKEKEVIYTPTDRYGDFELCHYSSVVWIEGFKFYFGSYREGVIDRMVEASTGCNGARSATPTDEDTLIKMFFKNLREHGGSLGEVVSKCYSRRKEVIQLWQINLLNI